MPFFILYPKKLRTPTNSRTTRQFTY